MLQYYENNPDAHLLNSEAIKKVWRTHPERMQNSLNALLDAAEKRKNGEMLPGALGNKHTEEWKQKRSEEMKETWKDPEYCKKVMARREKTGPEICFENIAEKYKLPYIFVGFHTIKIGGKNPDFIHKTKRKVIEIYGEYFHNEEEVAPRQKHFEKYGYKCLIIWAKELSNIQQILSKVMEFSL